MEPLPYVVVIEQRSLEDCAIAALAMLLGRTYEDVLDVAARVVQRPHRRGMWLTDLIAVAGELGVSLVRKRRADLDEDIGILSVETNRGPHVVVLRAGVVIDPSDHAVWLDLEAFAMKYRLGTLLRWCP